MGISDILCDDVILMIGEYLNNYDYRNLILSLNFFWAKDIYLRRRKSEIDFIIRQARREYLSAENLYNSVYSNLFFEIEKIENNNIYLKMDPRIANFYLKFWVSLANINHRDNYIFPEFWFAGNIEMTILRISNLNQINKIYLKELIDNNANIKSGDLIDQISNLCLLDEFMSKNKDKLLEIDFFRREIIAPTRLNTFEIINLTFSISIETFKDIFSRFNPTEQKKIRKDINSYLKKKNKAKKKKLWRPFLITLSEIQSLIR